MTPDVSSVCVGGVGTMSPVMTTTCRGEKVVGPSCLGGGWRIPYHVAYPMMHVMYLPPNLVNRQMHVKTLPSRNFVCGR